MKSEGQRMASSVKRILLPAIKRLGFTGSGVANFERSCGDHRDFLSIQYWKYGGSFILEFSRVASGWVDPGSGDAPSNVFDTESSVRKRLIDTTERRDFHGFSFKGFGDNQQAYDALASSVVALLPQVQGWLEDQIEGPNIH